MNRRLRTINEPARQTCHWLLEHDTYKTWRHGDNVSLHHGLLWIRGKPGSGKSTLLREAYRDALRTSVQATCCAFFFNAKGGRLERSVEGLYRSLLCQLLVRFPGSQVPLVASLQECRRQQRADDEGLDTSEFPWQESELKKFLEETINSQRGEHIIMFIDAVDECYQRARDIAYFLRGLTDFAYSCKVRLEVCFSSRQFPNISLRDCPEISVENFNAHDIALYADQKLAVGGLSQEAHNFTTLRDTVLEKASGVFLWVVLVVDRLLRDYDEGFNARQLTARLHQMPAPLSELFTDLLSQNHEDPGTTVRFFQWAILGAQNLRLREWRHVLCFVRSGGFASLEKWRRSALYPETDEQLEKQIRNISMGLVEVRGGELKAGSAQKLASEDIDSIGAGAGSLAEEGETRTVQVVHQSVREFFLNQNGFLALDRSLGATRSDRGTSPSYRTVFSTCLFQSSTHSLRHEQSRCSANKRPKRNPWVDSKHKQSHQGVEEEPTAWPALALRHREVSLPPLPFLVTCRMADPTEWAFSMNSTKSTMI